MLESDKFLILLLIFLLLKIVKKKSVAGTLNSFQYLAESPVMQNYSLVKKKKGGGGLKHMLEGF